MDDREALKKFMHEHGFKIDDLAEATGDTYSAIHMMVKGPRDVNEAFKWRFAKAFGWRKASEVFGIPAEPVGEVVQ